MLQPILHRVIVKPEDVPEKTSGGILLTAETREREKMSAIRGEIMAVGPTCFPDYESMSTEDAPPKVGDIIIMAKYGGTNVKHRGEDLRILNDVDVLAVIPKEDLEGQNV